MHSHVCVLVPFTLAFNSTLHLHSIVLFTFCAYFLLSSTLLYTHFFNGVDYAIPLKSYNPLLWTVSTVEHAALLTRGHVNRKKAGTYVRTVFSVRNLFLREKSSWQR